MHIRAMPAGTPRPRARTVRRVLAAAAGVALSTSVLAACSSGGDEKADYRPSPGRGDVERGPGVRIEPILPTPSLSGPRGGSQGPNRNPGGGSSSSARPKTDPLVVATDLAAPTGLTMLPDNTALVGERTTGRVVRVQPKPNRPVTLVRTITGIDTAGGGGLLDLALSPTYSEDSLIYAYISTAKDNRVVTFTLTGAVTPVITGIPKGRTGNAGRLQFVGSGGVLAIATGDAGKPSLRDNPKSLAGKVLRITDIGQPASGNPRSGSPVYASGLDRAAGICVIPETTTVLEVQPGSGGQAEINQVTTGGHLTSTGPVASAPAKYGDPGDCALIGRQLWMTSLDGKALLSAPVKGTGHALQVGTFTSALVNKYGRLKTVVAAKDGALWITTSNKDGNGKPVAADERVIRYVPDGGGGGSGSPV